jgi:hypothetical protein
MKSNQLAVSLPVTIPPLLHMRDEKSTIFKKSIENRSYCPAIQLTAASDETWESF